MSNRMIWYILGALVLVYVLSQSKDPTAVTGEVQARMDRIE